MTTERDEKRRTREMFGDPKVMIAEMQAFDRTSRFLSSQAKELLADHPGEYVAAYDERIVAFAASIEELRDKLDAQGIPRGRAAFRYLDPNPMPLLL